MQGTGTGSQSWGGGRVGIFVVPSYTTDVVVPIHSLSSSGNPRREVGPGSAPAQGT